MSKNVEKDHELPLVLVAEDDADLLWYIVSELRHIYQVETCINGREGLEKALELIPDLIVTDLMMPVMDGVEFCKALKENQLTSHIPVIMLTAKTSVESQVEGLETGADDYVTKPFHMVLLQARIDNLLESRRLLRERFSSELLPEDIPERSVDRVFLERAVRTVEENYADPAFKSDEFAQALGMSVRSLQRKLKALVDRAPAKFIYEIRMKRAKQLLISSKLTVTEIAFEVGCEDSSHFSRMFKQQFKINPSKYRAAHSSE